MNEIPFIPDAVHEFRNVSFISTLTLLVERLVNISSAEPKLTKESVSSISRRGSLSAKDKEEKTQKVSIESIVDTILQRGSRTGTGSDSFFVIQNMVCSPDTFVTQRSSSTDPPIKVDVFLNPERNELLARVEAKNVFSVFDMSSVEDEADLSKEPAPILNVDTVIVDETNFGSMCHKRYLRARAHVPFRRVDV